MSLGLGIFLSTIIVSLLLLYRWTRDRWNWRRGLKRLAFWSIGISVVVGISSWGYLQFKNRPIKQTGYSDLNLGMTKDEVVYVKGSYFAWHSSKEKYRDWRDVPIVNDATQAERKTTLPPGWTYAPDSDIFDQIAKQNEYFEKNYKNFESWSYDIDNGARLKVDFDNGNNRLKTISCSSTGYKYCPPVLGIYDGSSEDEVLKKLGPPDESKIDGQVKIMNYYDLNTSMYLKRKKVYMIVVGFQDSNNETDSSPQKSLTVPTYDTKGWTQENTNSSEAGPWLKFDPPGTRYCRYYDGIIIRLYPPGVMPNADPANPFCLGESQEQPPKYLDSTPR